MQRRTVLASLPGTLLLGGCTDILTQERTTFEAERAVVSESARSDTDYREVNRAAPESEREFAGKSIIVINKITEYARTMDLPLAGGGQLGRFSVLASPEVTVAGEVLNPIADMDNDELAMTVQEQYESIENVQKIDDRQAQLLGVSTKVSRYRADAETEGESAEVHLHVAKGESERSDGDTDFIIPVGVNPSDIDERERIDRLISGVRHPA